MPARILMQDFPGVPAVVDLAAMRDGIAALGGDPAKVNPLIPTELVIDHSVTVEAFATPDAFAVNARVELERNIERYQFLRWGQQAFRDFRVVPPTPASAPGQPRVPARVVFVDEAPARPTPTPWSHRQPHADGERARRARLGRRWHRGEAAMLGQPISMLVPSVVGFRLTVSCPRARHATDLVLTVTELLRRHGVVGKFVEFYGTGVANVPLENRATIGKVPRVTGRRSRSSRSTTRRCATALHQPTPGAGRSGRALRQGTGSVVRPGRRPRSRDARARPLVRVCPASPGRPAPRTGAARQAKSRFATALVSSLPDPPASSAGGHEVAIRDAPADPTRGRTDRRAGRSGSAQDEASAESFPASDPPAAAEGRTGVGQADGSAPAPDGWPARPTVIGGASAGDGAERPRAEVPVTLGNGTDVVLDHGHVVIAAITSCTNTSNPSVMLGAGLLAKRAVERGLGRKPWVKTSLAPGSKVVVDYYERAGLTPYLDQLGFNLVGFGCTTCIGNSGPLRPRSPRRSTPRVSPWWRCCRQPELRGPHQRRCPHELPRLSPAGRRLRPAGTMDIDLSTEPLGAGSDGEPVYLRDIWPTAAEVAAAVEQSVRSEMFEKTYSEIFEGDERWKALETPEGSRFAWDDEHSTYVHKPPFFDGMPAEPAPLRDITDARVLAVLGDSVTTDHISPAGSIRAASPAGRWLVEQGVDPGDFNSYGARRQPRGDGARHLRQPPHPQPHRPRTRRRDPALPDGEPLRSTTGHALRGDGPPRVLAGKEYGSGRRGLGAKGTFLLGVRRDRRELRAHPART